LIQSNFLVRRDVRRLTWVLGIPVELLREPTKGNKRQDKE